MLCLLLGRRCLRQCDPNLVRFHGVFASVAREVVIPGPAWEADTRDRNLGGEMALLIVNLDRQIGNVQAWRDTFAAQLPDLEIRIWPEAGEVRDIEYLAFIRPDFGILPAL